MATDLHDMGLQVLVSFQSLSGVEDAGIACFEAGCGDASALFGTHAHRSGREPRLPGVPWCHDRRGFGRPPRGPGWSTNLTWRVTKSLLSRGGARTWSSRTAATAARGRAGGMRRSAFARASAGSSSPASCWSPFSKTHQTSKPRTFIYPGPYCVHFKPETQTLKP